MNNDISLLPSSEQQQSSEDFVDPTTSNIVTASDSNNRVPLSKLQALMQEGENKGFSDYQIDVIQMIGDVCIRANQFENDIRKVLKDIKDATISNKEVKPKVSIEELIEMQRQGNLTKVWMSELEELDDIIKEVQDYDDKCKDYLNKANLLNLDEDKQSNVDTLDYLQ